ncbi:hypothetical protein [Fibrella arboris]|uniref:hypothetical protein n=1 Tax=Fibrella arboris TaxID=3242486 RepID=UPI003522ACA7
MENRKGIIAESYTDLQALPDLERASKSYVTGKDSPWSLIKILLQSLEISIQNLNDLFERIIFDLNNNKLGKAVIKLGWIKDINNLTMQISSLVNMLYGNSITESSQSLSTTSSQILLNSTYEDFDVAINGYLKRKSINLFKLLETKMLNNDLYIFFHYYRIISHELVIWNENMQKYSIPINTNYDEFVGLSDITHAVDYPKLKGDTFFKQFRGLHQIPELITYEVNNRIEISIVGMRNGRYEIAHNHLKVANNLLKITVQSLKPIVNNLSHNDYHKIRENLGLTSGSHSVNIHFHLFRDLYTLISTEYINTFFKNEEEYKLELQSNYTLKLVETELLNLRYIINQWRDLHLHLPRVNLGENKTKSLIGSQEAVDAVRKMQSAANIKDPLNKLDALYFKFSQKSESNLLNYIKSENSFDTILGKHLGELTQLRFKSVQEREGVFAKTVKFTNPPKREV